MAGVITGQHVRMLDFLGATSKSLQKPMQEIRASLTEIGPDKPLVPEGRVRKAVATSARELDRLDQQVLAFLDASRMEWQRLDLQQPKQDVRALAREVVRVYEAFSTVHQVALSAPDQPVLVCFDEGRMTQVLNTLLSNAIQFSPRGGLVTVTLSTSDKEAFISVADHGVGIPADAIAKIFEPFHDIRDATQPRLGAVALSVAKRIVEAHQGHIEVESQVGTGTTFRVCLPLARRADEERHVSEHQAPPSGTLEPAPST
jgi:signal transduction histidine kinase